MPQPRPTIFHALALSLGQLAEPRVLRLLLKSLAVTLVIVAVLGAIGWWLLEDQLGRLLVDTTLSGLLATAVVLFGGWLLWRIVAFTVLQFFADDVVVAVEERYYPAAAVNARRLGWHEELRHGLSSAGRALIANLIAAPFALALLVTGVGTALLFWLVNAVLLGRELMDLVWLRHRRSASEPAPLSAIERFALGGIVAALLIVPFANLLAPFLGAAMAAHLIHRKGTLAHAG
jgi:hypothetical protein